MIERLSEFGIAKGIFAEIFVLVHVMIIIIIIIIIAQSWSTFDPP